MSTLDLGSVRARFPALAETVHGQPLAFLDGPGGTQVPQAVIDAITHYLITSNANVHYPSPTSQRTDAVIAEAHAAMADLLGCDADEVIFGANMTTLTFALSRAIGRELGTGDEVVITRLDHDANVAPWQALAERGITVRAVDVDIEDCTLDMADFAAKITPHTKLVAVGYASNAVGTINDIKTVVEMAHAVGAQVFVDAVHYAPHGPIDVRALDCDFLACSPYKFFGPHAGVIYGKREHLTRLQPYKVRPATEELPYRWETGTQNHEGMAGVAAAVNYLATLGVSGQGSGVRSAPVSSQIERRQALVAAMTDIQAYERTLSEQLIGGLLDIPGLTFYGIREPERFGQRTPTVSFNVAGHSALAVHEHLVQHGILASHGNYYALNLSERLGAEEQGGMVRIGAVHYNTPDEIDRLLHALRALTA